MDTTIINGFGDIVADFDALIVDLWGVTHNGRDLFPQAVEAFRLAKARGTKVLFLSNAPRRQESVYSQLDRFGLDRDLYLGAVTSGELAWEWIRSAAGRSALGARAYHLGAGEKDANMRAGLDHVTFTDQLTDASFILNTGPEDAITHLQGFQDLMATALAHKLPMVCANPDLSVFRGMAEELCAGAIAEAYQTMGGTVHWFGKPWAAVYDRCLETLDYPDPSRILCIGDSMRTDISGAAQNGLKSLLVGTGLRRTDLVDQASNQFIDGGLMRLAQEYKVSPTFACVALRP